MNANIGGGWTPLQLAAERGYLAIVKLLVEHGADVHAKTPAVPEMSSADLPGQPPPTPGEKPEPPTIFPAVPARTALQWAQEEKHDDVVKYLESLSN